MQQSKSSSFDQHSQSHLGPSTTRQYLGRVLTASKKTPRSANAAMVVGHLPERTSPSHEEGQCIARHD